MADKKGIRMLDEKLAAMDILPEALIDDLPLVHKKMNSIVKKTGAVLSDEVFETGTAALRKWLIMLDKQGASQEKLTAYLRSGLAHLTYDYLESQFKQIGLEDLVTRTLVSMKKRKLHLSYYKAPAENAAPKKSTAKKGIIKAIRKTAAK